MVKTTEGYRLDTIKWTTTPLQDIEDFQALKKGDRIAVYCPMRKRKFGDHYSQCKFQRAR